MARFMRRLPRLTAFLAVSLFSLTHTELVCYNQSGNQDDTQPCDPSAEVSACCSPGDICFTNGLCEPGPQSNKTTDTTFFADGCTNATYQGPECLAFDMYKNVTGNGVQTCLNNRYCCYGLGGCDCSDPNAVFTLPAGDVITTLALSTSSTISTTAVSTTDVPATSTAAAIAQATTSPTEPAGSSNDHKGLGIGLGVGLGIPLIAAIIGAWLYWRRKQKRRRVEPGNSLSKEEYIAPGFDSKTSAISPGKPHPAQLDSQPIPEVSGVIATSGTALKTMA